MKSYNIALIPGDGTGPEVLAEGVKVLNAACAKHGIKLNYQSFDFGGERYKRTGEILPDSALEEFKKFDSIFLGAIGHPDVKPGILEVGILLKTRFALDQYINLRPVKQAGLQPRRRLHHVVRQAARVLRRNRHREPVRRHHH
jgi:3-isopropylmalate dehydrogenase